MIRRKWRIVAVGAFLAVLAVLNRLLLPSTSSHSTTQRSVTEPVATEEGPWIAPGELPGYTGWGRPDSTLAGFLSAPSFPTSALAGESFSFDVRCSGNDECKSTTSWFYARAYGPAVILGRVKATAPGRYSISFLPVDAGVYTVELVVTFSRPPSIDQFPLANSSEHSILYEGYLISGFPKQLQVVPNRRARVDERKACQIDELLETSATTAYGKGRWIVTDSNRNRQQSSTNNVVSFIGYQRSNNSLGVTMEYSYGGCKLMRPPSAKFHPYYCMKEPIQIIMVGDSVMRLQYDLLKAYIGENHPGIRLTYTKLLGGILRSQHYAESPEQLPKSRQSPRGPYSDPSIRREMEKLTNTTKARNIVVFNSGLHDIHRLCGDEFIDDRPTYLANPNEGCLAVYRRALDLLVSILASYPADMRIYQTTTAGWPKYGNYGVRWDPRYGQALPLDAPFVEAFNEIAVPVMIANDIKVVDGYWISAPRPDNREIDEKSSLGKKLSHPGYEVMETMLRVWSMVVLRYYCG